jgi:flagellar biosynthesis protein
MIDAYKSREIKEAAAISYTPGEDSAPKIIAVGKGEIAEKILEKAEENKIPIHHDTTLAHTLAALNIGDHIPPELYEVVAQVMVFVAGLDQKVGERLRK